MSTTAPKYSESIPAVTTPVKLPSLLPGRARFVTGVVTGGVLIVITLGLLILALAVTS